MTEIEVLLGIITLYLGYILLWLFISYDTMRAWFTGAEFGYWYRLSVTCTAMCVALILFFSGNYSFISAVPYVALSYIAVSFLFGWPSEKLAGHETQDVAVEEIPTSHVISHEDDGDVEFTPPAPVLVVDNT